jgi:ubiquinone/menaquinone biosynthesis C-methylase UbiE
LSETYSILDLEKFEAFINQQEEIATESYDNEYFEGQWRDNQNSYDFEKRREIEGRNPALIKDTFKPIKALDMGCGPGALMLFLHELGVECHGIDGSKTSKDIAKDEISKLIKISDICETNEPDNEYDLIICREVLEHLTFKQIKKSVEEMARITSQYVYITTRFHPDPQSIYDISTEPEVDPTHITCLNIEMLRLLCVISGLKRRKDLEEKMDWLSKGRVLVYEKQKA